MTRYDALEFAISWMERLEDDANQRGDTEIADELMQAQIQLELIQKEGRA